MDRPARRILLSIDPIVLEGALARLLSADSRDEVVQLRQMRGSHGDYDAAVVSSQLRGEARAGVVITLPDTRGGGGTGTVSSRGVVHTVSIASPEQVIELLEEYAPRPQIGPLVEQVGPVGRGAVQGRPTVSAAVPAKEWDL